MELLGILVGKCMKNLPETPRVPWLERVWEPLSWHVPAHRQHLLNDQTTGFQQPCMVGSIIFFSVLRWELWGPERASYWPKVTQQSWRDCESQTLSFTDAWPVLEVVWGKWTRGEKTWLWVSAGPNYRLGQATLNSSCTQSLYNLLCLHPELIGGRALPRNWDCRMMRWDDDAFGVRQAWIGILGSPHPGCVTPGKLPTLSGPPLPAFIGHTYHSCSFVRVKHVNVGEGHGTAKVPIKLGLFPLFSRGNVLKLFYV